MEVNTQRFSHIMFYFFKKSKNTTEMQKKICAVCGEGAVTDRTCQKWFVKFHTEDFLLDNAPGLGRPVEVDYDQMETLTENNQRCTMWEVANILKISKSLKLLVKMKNVSLILWKKTYGLFGQPNTYSFFTNTFPLPLKRIYLELQIHFFSFQVILCKTWSSDFFLLEHY